ncbi:MAG: FAD-binding oxidoreductase [Sphingomonadaceae bacterium]|uniref:NAD(P)/FAD-dependent oxidoreductase n=1 Tax=Thermaurantiacus sp. TaxID=2820283 RepID=UPI00298F276B|nr:FAD-binding oxidoreductase [Thermaurantiacus sp.]MCS6987870.1 FAD-binding oxidoreductase [Sphingomonadaceae bacterium]MDW8414910.1 FAD-binding oxidoreductase [Thermaurantiacus sp.]
MSSADVAIVGAGIAGASLAHALLARAPGLKLLLLEAEDQPGYHTTGRSAAFYAETYGGPDVRPLTTASKAFFQRPPPGFCATALLSPRGALHVAHADRIEALDRLEAEFAQGMVAYQRLEAAGVQAKAPFLRPEWATAALWEPGCADIDVAALHQAYLRSARRLGATLVTRARLERGVRTAGGWRIETTAGTFAATRLVDAAGAWGDVVAAACGMAPMGLAPLRRTIAVAEVTPEAPADLPVVMDAGGAIYFKPDAGRLWISPHDETPDVPRDVQPEELDVAIALDRFERLCDWPIRRLAAKWAGLRTFAPDRLPVIGPDPDEPAFIWCVGQGGWGIQTAPAAAELGAALILGHLPGIDWAHYAPSRFRRPAA